MSVPAAWVAELSELMRIPSVSADPDRGPELRAAAAWIGAFVERSGGHSRIVETGDDPPIVHATVPASEGSGDRAPAVLLYGHYDVQPPGDESAWSSPPFEPEVRGDWLHGRGASDDKGNLYALLKAVESMRAEGRLPVDVTVLCDGEEEVLGTSVCDYLDRGEVDADACLIFDAPMLDMDTPQLIVGSRGMVYMRLRLRANREDLHSGLFGGAALNAAHVLIDVLRAAIDGRGTLTDGAAAPSTAERETWDRLPTGAEVLAASGALPADDAAAATFYERTLAAPAVDVTSLTCGDPWRQANVIPSRAEAHLSVRVAPGQLADDCAAGVLALIDAATPAGVTVDVETWSSVDGSLISVDSPALERMRGSFRRTLGVDPPLVRTGGSLPIVSALDRRGIPVGLTGFAPAEARVHSTDERLYLPHLTAGVSLARAILQDLA